MNTTRHRGVSLIQVFDATRQSPTVLAYLERRLTAEVRKVSVKLIVRVASHPATPNDVKALGPDDCLAAILGKGGAGQAIMLCEAQPVTASALSKQELRTAIAAIFSGRAGTAGVTWGRVSIVPTAQLSPFSDASSQSSDQAFLSNLLIHEVGHAISQRPPKVDHALGGVMRPSLTNSDAELGYPAAFVKSVAAYYR